jgi:hypothetical protein
MGKQYARETSICVSVAGLDWYPLEIAHKTKTRTWVKIAVSTPGSIWGDEELGLGIRLVTDGTSETDDDIDFECILSVPDGICEFLTDEEATIARAEYWRKVSSRIDDPGPDDLRTTRKLKERSSAVISLRRSAKPQD